MLRQQRLPPQCSRSYRYSCLSILHDDNLVLLGETKLSKFNADEGEKNDRP
mgnify:CR=1 FL=1